jgi:multidrug efflux system outer membrane protein
VAVGLAALALFSAGCMRLGPDWEGPPKVENPAAGYQHAGPGPVAFQPRDQWWRVFGDPEINRLVERALTRNLDLTKATAQVLEAAAGFHQAQGQRFPQIGLSGEVERSQASGGSTSALLRSLGNSGGPTTSHNLTLAASFELDLWGRLSRASQAARAELMAAEQNRRTVAQSIVAAVVSTYLQMEAVERRIAVAENRLHAYQTSLDLVDQRYRRGLTGSLALRQAMRALAVAQTTLPALRMELGEAQQNLAVLTGDYPRTSPARSQPENYYHQPAPVPPGLPSELLKRRPDILAAEASLEARTARVGVAKAARFPTISLTGAYGTASSELSDLFTAGNDLWSLAGGLSMPIFKAGALAAAQRAAEARLEQSLAVYAKAVLDAFAEVENALLTRQETLERRDLVAAALEEANATQNEALSRYQRGLSDYLSVLEAQKTSYELADDLVLTELAVLTNRVTLHRVLGGGWDELKPAAPDFNPLRVDHGK